MADTYLFAGKDWYLSSSISSTQTTINLASFKEPVSGVNMTMALMNSTVAYGTLDPRSANSELISFTGITQNANGTATLTGVTRGLKRGYDYTSSSTFMLPHASRSIFILSDSPQALYSASPLSQAGGSTTEVQYNNAGLFSGISTMTTTGTVTTVSGAGNLRMTSPRITTSILDTNGVTIIGLTATASANTYVVISNANSGAPSITSSSGSQPLLLGGGTGYLRLSGDGTGSTSDGLSISTPGGDNTTITPITTNKNINLGGSGAGIIRFTTSALVASGSLGYTTGAGGTQTQGTSRTTGVTLDKICGAITLFSAAGSTTPATFTVTNSTVAATDTIIVNQKSGTDLYTLSVTRVATGAFDITFNTKSGTTVEQPVFNFTVLKAVTS